MCTLTSQFTEECVSYGNITEAIFTNNADFSLQPRKKSSCVLVYGAAVE